MFEDRQIYIVGRVSLPAHVSAKYSAEAHMHLIPDTISGLDFEESTELILTAVHVHTELGAALIQLHEGDICILANGAALPVATGAAANHCIYTRSLGIAHRLPRNAINVAAVSPDTPCVNEAICAAIAELILRSSLEYAHVSTRCD